MYMFEELDRIILNHDIKEYSLKEGDRGTIVHVYGKGEGYEVEFFNVKGDTIAVITLTPNDIHLISSERRYLIHGFSSPIYASNASGMTYTIGAENVLRGFDSIFGIDETKVKEESRSKATIEEFNFPIATL